MFYYRPVEEIVDDLRLALTSAMEFEYAEYFGPSLTSYLYIASSSQEECPYEISVFTEIPTPHRLVEYDPDGMKALLEEYRRGLLAIKVILEEGYHNIREFAEREEFHKDIVSLETPVCDPADAAEIILKIRKAIGLKDPLTMSGLKAIEKAVLVELTKIIVKDLIDLVTSGQTRISVGWRTSEQLEEALPPHMGLHNIQVVLSSLQAGKYIEKKNDKIRARIGTGALLEALSKTDDFYSCLLWPYALGYTHSEWRIFYANKEQQECLKLHEKIVNLELEGIKLL